MYKTLSPMQKLEALAQKNYRQQVWQPKQDDYYTSQRADLELYKIIEIKDGKIYTVYCDKECSPQVWDEKDFTNNGFGLYRVHVPQWVLELKI